MNKINRMILTSLAKLRYKPFGPHTFCSRKTTDFQIPNMLKWPRKTGQEGKL